VIEVVKRLVGILKFVLELPQALVQLDDQARKKVEAELNSVKHDINQIQKAIAEVHEETTKKKKTWLSAM